jgi:hypothetical protein
MLYEDKINICTGPSNAENSAAQVDVVVPKETLSTAQLKKKEIRTRSSKRKNLGGKESTRGGEKGQSKNLLQVQVPKVCQKFELVIYNMPFGILVSCISVFF